MREGWKEGVSQSEGKETEREREREIDPNKEDVCKPGLAPPHIETPLVYSEARLCLRPCDECGIGSDANPKSLLSPWWMSCLLFGSELEQ